MRTVVLLFEIESKIFLSSRRRPGPIRRGLSV